MLIPAILSLDNLYFLAFPSENPWTRNSVLAIISAKRLASLKTGPGADLPPDNVTNDIDPILSLKILVLFTSIMEAIATDPDPRHLVVSEGAFLASHDDFYYLWFNHGVYRDFDLITPPAPGEEYIPEQLPIVALMLVRALI
ncbi:endo-1-5-alpha-L-arabinosidase [Penicillium longicatenatum]|uniref:endo-1-5-alpha-L-arabinosidase n=1 Tax=Penicillium longicatenatum TaxID=1561947 RepID=UPI0025499C22|nr:endo-1-5-alpha-L-arabinosidase [Penicillium longicatenatum]KAJ5658692.1 endo-1-5-alpha-L-arabinosidase [Penicillium longicatenatum]